MKQLFIAYAICALFAAGCTHNMTDRDMTLQDDFGNAVKTNIAVQTINPEAAKKVIPVASGDGQKTEEAMKQYRKPAEKVSSKGLMMEIKRQ